MKDAGRIGFLIRGDYEEKTAYDFLDIVYYAGNSYVAKKETTGNPPVESSEYWQIFATGASKADDYGNLVNKPRISGVELSGDVSLDDIGAVAAGGDTASNTISFYSDDSNDPAGWTDIALLESGEKHSSILAKISTAIKNVRYLWKMLGGTDISAIGNGTVTGAISELNGKIEDLNTRLGNYTFHYPPVTDEEYEALAPHDENTIYFRRTSDGD